MIYTFEIKKRGSMLRIFFIANFCGQTDRKTDRQTDRKTVTSSQKKEKRRNCGKEIKMKARQTDRQINTQTYW